MTQDNITTSNLDAIKEQMAVICSEEREQVSTAAPPAPPEGIRNKEVVEAYHNSEDGDAFLFVKLNAGKWVYDYAIERWFKYREHTWEIDAVDQVIAEVAGVVDLYLRAAADQADLARQAEKDGNASLAKAHEDFNKKLIDRARKCQGLARKKKVIELARSGVNTLGTDGMQWDLDPWSLGCPNGVINLKTGTLRPGTPEDYIQTVCPTPYLGLDTPCPAWEKFLLEVFNQDEELVGYVQRLFGYSVTGLALEHIFPVLQGQGRNGKGTMLELFHHILGPLAGPISSEMLLDQYQPRSAAAPSPDIINLKGKRLVWASETDEGRRLSLSRIKWLTGGDTLVGRPPNGKVMIEFRPSHTLFLLTNPLPHAPGDDYALWERVKLIHFPFSFVDDPKLENERPQNKELPDRLKTEATGILAWLVRGCIAWQKEGLGTAAAIQLATKGYQGEEDLVGQFLEECTIEDQSSQVQASELYGAYRRWSQAAGLTPKSSTWFGKQMRKRGVDAVKFGTVSYLGLALRRQETRQEQLPEQSG